MRSIESIFAIELRKCDEMIELGILLMLGVLTISYQSWRRSRRAQEEQHEVPHKRIEKLQMPPSLHPFIDLDRCIGCGSCVASCPEAGVLGMVNLQAALVRADHCVGHGKCEAACPVGAITLVLGSAAQGVEVPVTDEFFQTRVPGIYVAGELRGVGLIRNALLQGMQCLDAIAARPRRLRADFEVIIVGAGPAGLGATLQAAAKKIQYLTLEQDDIGGAIIKYPRRKIVMTAPLHLPGYGKIHFREVRKEDLLQEWQKIITTTGVKIHTQKRVDQVAASRHGFLEVTTGGERYTAGNIILALGRRGTPRKLGVPGEQLAKVVYQLEEAESFAGRRCLVVGGGDSAIECALQLAAAGAMVTFSYRQGTISRARIRNRQLLQEAIQQRRVRALMPSVVREIGPEAVSLEVEGQIKMLHNDNVFVMAGGVLPFEFLKQAGIAMRTLYGEPLAGRKVA